MKYTIHGFSQEVAIKLDIEHDGLLFLRWFVDFIGTNRMVKRVIGDDIFYWVQYEKVCEELPILSSKRDTIYRKLQKLVDADVLKHHTTKNKTGTYSWYAFGTEYAALVSNTASKKNSEKNPSSSEDLGKKSESVDNDSEKNPSTPEDLGKKSRPKDPSINLYSLSIKDQSVSQSVTPTEKDTKPETKETDGQAETTYNEEYIKNQIQYADMFPLHERDKKLIDEIVFNILDMYYSNGIKIKEDFKPQAIVRSVLAKLTEDHIVYIVDRFKKVRTPITNKMLYLQAMIYTSVLELMANGTNQFSSEEY